MFPSASRLKSRNPDIFNKDVDTKSCSTLTEHADFVTDFDYLIQTMGAADSNQPAAPELSILAVSHYAANNVQAGLKNPDYKLEGGAPQIVLDPADLKEKHMGKRRPTGWG